MATWDQVRQGWGSFVFLYGMAWALTMLRAFSYVLIFHAEFLVRSFPMSGEVLLVLYMENIF